MLKQLKVKNFRSVGDATIDFAPITLLYGPNGSGKSSILYAPFIFKNVVLNSNQSVDTFFSFLFANLGGFDQVVHRHDINKKIEIQITYLDEFNKSVIYGVSLGKKEGRFWLKKSEEIDLSLAATFPYPGNARTQQIVKLNESEMNVVWNGITANLSAQPQTTEMVELSQKMLSSLNKGAEILRTLDIIPFKRGFSKFSYSTTPVSAYQTEEEIATILGSDSYLEGKVLAKFKKIFGKIFRVRAQLGTALFSLQVTDESGITNELINDGFGLNQTLFILAKLLRNDAHTILIEEPEIHLHPSAQNKLAQIFAEIVKEEEKTLIIETHSEIIVSSFLALVSEKYITPQDIRCYFITKPERETVIEEQTINEKGQITGGLISFMEEEIKPIKKIWGVKEEK